MPFGNGSSRLYDFNKVQRVIIQRAIQQAYMQPVRADETIETAIIHGAMFKDLEGVEELRKVRVVSTL